MKLRSVKRCAVGDRERAGSRHTDMQIAIQDERRAGAVEGQRPFRIGAVHAEEGIDAPEIGALAQRHGADAIVAYLKIAAHVDVRTSSRCAERSRRARIVTEPQMAAYV